MAKWDSRYQGHALWTTVQELRTKLDEYVAPEDELTREMFDYAAAACAMVEARRKATTAIMVTPAMLDTSDAAVRRVIDSFRECDEDLIEPPALEPPIDAMVATFTTWPAPTGEAVATAVSEQLKRLSDQATEIIDSITQKRDELVAGMTTLGNNQAALEALIDEQKASASRVVTSFETTSSDALTARNNEWATSRSRSEEKAQEKLEAIEALRVKAEEVVHTTTGVSTATDFGEYARRQGIVAFLYDLVAGGVGIAGVAALMVHLYDVGEGTADDLGLSLTRLAASIGVLGVAGLIGARGGQHHAEARAAKRTDLTLRRIEPFTANLDDDTKQAIIEETTARIFIRGELNPVEQVDDVTVGRIRTRAAELFTRRNPPVDEE